MQKEFNHSSPSGCLETDELDGVSWKSERPVREKLSEDAVAQAVAEFEEQSHREMERQKQHGVCGVIQGTYRVMQVELEITRNPWERIPRVRLKKKREERRNGL